jgi:glucose 1-dehydrogenase
MKPPPATGSEAPASAPLDLKGARCLITGASSGLGAGMARAFAAAGCAVVVNHLPDQAAAAARVVGDVVAAGVEGLAIAADISRPAEVAALFDAAADRLGGLDILVANAGIQRDAPVADMSLSQWQAVLDVDLTGGFLCAQAAIRQFRRQSRDRARARGSIIFISSVHQEIPWATHANYAAAKGGVKLLMESLAQEVAPEGIRVNAIAPGAIRTAINRPAWATPAALRKLLTLIPYGRIGEAEDVARAAVWLASEAADYVVGTTLFVDGGMRLYPGFAHGG